MATTRMSVKRQYTLIIRGKVQSVGFRGYVEEACERLGIGGIGYNIGTEEVRVLCKANMETAKELIKLLRKYEFAEISQLDLKEGILLPDVYYRSIFGTEKEIFGRLDEGVKVLHEIKSDTGKIGETNKEVLKVLKGISDKL